jgi:hypothetical protein
MNKPLKIYWSPFTFPESDGGDWSFLYPNPKTLYSDLKQQVSDNSDSSSYLSCPALSDKFKRTLVFYSPMDCSYTYDFTKEEPEIIATTDEFINMSAKRMSALNNTALLRLHLFYIMFAEESVEAYFTPPMFHKPGYTQTATSIPGAFDIGQWFRPYVMEIQAWGEKGEIHIKKDEPLFYVELKTDRPIEFHRFEPTLKIKNYADSCVDTTNMFGRGQNLISRYARFKDVGMRAKILKEINNNLL